MPQCAKRMGVYLLAWTLFGLCGLLVYPETAQLAHATLDRKTWAQ